MAPKSIFQTMALMLGVLAFSPDSGAQDATVTAGSNAGGFRTDQLSPRQVRVWNAVRKIALATDRHGHPLYPTLQGLWSTVEKSTHLVFVELITDSKHCSNMAAETVVEEPDPAGRRHTIRVKLFLPTIDRIYPGEQESREGMAFVPFSGLRREQRYAKVLGHELAHVATILHDPDYLRLVQEICTEQKAIAVAVEADGKHLSDGAFQARWNRIWPIVLEVEKPALAAEAAIYRELLGGD